MAYGKIIYPSGDPDAITYNFVKNYDPEPVIGYLETMDNQRSFDGTLNGFSGALKKYYELTFSYVSLAQYNLFMNLYRFQVALDLYLDGDSLSPNAVVFIMNSPAAGPAGAFDDSGNPPYSSFTIRFEEI